MLNTSWIFVELFLYVVTDLHPIIRRLFRFEIWKQLSIELFFAMCVFNLHVFGIKIYFVRNIQR